MFVSCTSSRSLNRCLRMIINWAKNYFDLEDAISKFGHDNIKCYETSFTPMYHALTDFKAKCTIKLICTGDDERVSPCEVLCLISCAHWSYLGGLQRSFIGSDCTNSGRSRLDCFKLLALTALLNNLNGNVPTSFNDEI